MSLLNSVQSNQESRLSSSPASSHHSSSQHQNNPVSMNGVKQSLHGGGGARAGAYGQDVNGMRTLHVKPELQQQHSVDSIEAASHSQNSATTAPQRSPASGGRLNMGSSIVEACSRYGITGSTPTSPECSSSNRYGTVMTHSQQSYNPYSSASRPSLSSPPSGHCVPNAFNFSVNNLIHRNYPKI